MKPCLLDVSVLVALFWNGHPAHHKAVQWFVRNAKAGWATCPLTQAGFVRVVSNPSFSKSSTTVPEAAKLLRENLAHPAHRYWPADISFFEATEKLLNRVAGYRQSTDAYLLGLAMHNRGYLVTMDHGIVHLLPDKSQRLGLVTLIG